MTDESAAQAAVQMAVATFGRLDVVANNAGCGDIAPFEQLSAERFKAVMDSDFDVVVNVTRAAVPLMREQKERLHPPDTIGRRPPDSAWQHAVPCSEMGCRRPRPYPLPRSCPRSA